MFPRIFMERITDGGKRDVMLNYLARKRLLYLKQKKMDEMTQKNGAREKKEDGKERERERIGITEVDRI